MKKLAGILVLLFFIPVSVDSQQPILVIELSSDGEATVTQLLSAKSIVSSISVPLISDRTSKILATDERGILLKTTQSGDSLNVATLGASAVTLTYKADITSFDSQAWNVSYEADTETVVVLPQLATIVSVSSIPLDIEDNAVIMPPGPVSITYVINEVSSKTFFVLEGGQNYPVEITSASNIDDFFKQSNEIRFRISGSSTILVVVPSIVLPNPIDASLNGGEVTFNPYYHNGTHNWIRIDPHESGVIEIGGDVRASQVLSDNPMMNEGSGENDSIFLNVGIILGVLALGFVVFTKYFKIGLVRTNSSKDSNQFVKSRKHVKKNMKSGHFGILALVSLSILLTVPSAFAQETGIPNAAGHANAAFNLMDLITNGQTEAATLNQMIANNGLNVSLDEYAEALDEAAGLVAAGEYEDAEAVLADADEILDDVYTQFYAQVDSRQNERFTEFVENAIDSISFIIDNNSILGISPMVIEELEATLVVLEDGNYDEILAATGETSDLGLTTLMFPEDHPGFGNASPDNNGKGKGLGLGEVPPGIQNLPDKIKDKFGYSTDSNPSTVSYEEAGNDNGENNDYALPPGFENKLLDADGVLIEDFDDNNLPNGFLKKFDGVLAFLDSDVDVISEDLPGGFAKKLAAGDALPKGFVKKYNAIAETFEFASYGDAWWSETGDAIFDDDGKKVKKAKKAKKDKSSKTNNGNGGNNGGGNNGGGNNGGGNCPPGQAKKGNC